MINFHATKFFKHGQLIKIRKPVFAIDFYDWWTSGPNRLDLKENSIHIILGFKKFKTQVLNETVEMTGVEVMDVGDFKKKTIPFNFNITKDMLEENFEILKDD